MRFTFRMANALVALVTLASAVAVLVSDVVQPGYREYHRDALWFVTAYCAVQGVMLVSFVRDGPLVRWLVLAKTAAAYLFLANFVALWPYWRLWTPARYVYALFDAADGSQVGVMALVFLGRGAFNTVNAVYFTRDWWIDLRHDRPLLGRVLSAVPAGAVVFCLWAFLGLVREEARTHEPRQVARRVWDGLDCAAVRANLGKTTTDVRRLGERTYGVAISYDCALTRVRVHTEDGRAASVAGPRADCCDGEGPRGPEPAPRSRHPPPATSRAGASS